MDKKSKELLINDLCARLPHGVIVQMTGKVNPVKLKHINIDAIPMMNPYLRPMSSMTEEEREELEHLSEEYFGKALDKQIQESLSSSNENESRILEYIASSVIIDWLNKHHFDYRGLIEKGLALEALPGMYNIKQE